MAGKPSPTCFPPLPVLWAAASPRAPPVRHESARRWALCSIHSARRHAVNGIAIDAAGNAVIAGRDGRHPRNANAFNHAPGPAQKFEEIGLTVQVSTHAFAAKLNAGASAISMHLAHGSCGDVATDVAIDSTGAAWVGGTTYSPISPRPRTHEGSFPTASGRRICFAAEWAGDGFSIRPLWDG